MKVIKPYKTTPGIYVPRSTRIRTHDADRTLLGAPTVKAYFDSLDLSDLLWCELNEELTNLKGVLAQGPKPTVGSQTSGKAASQKKATKAPTVTNQKRLEAAAHNKAIKALKALRKLTLDNKGEETTYFHFMPKDVQASIAAACDTIPMIENNINVRLELPDEDHWTNGLPISRVIGRELPLLCNQFLGIDFTLSRSNKKLVVKGALEFVIKCAEALDLGANPETVALHWKKQGRPARRGN
jgi:hypothetical protein